MTLSCEVKMDLLSFNISEILVLLSFNRVASPCETLSWRSEVDSRSGMDHSLFILALKLALVLSLACLYQ